MDTLRPRYDYVILDTRGGFDVISALASVVADVSFLVGPPDQTGLDKMALLIKKLGGFNKDVLKCDFRKPAIVFNQVDPRTISVNSVEKRIEDCLIVANLPFTMGVRRASWDNKLAFMSELDDPFMRLALKFYNECFPEALIDGISPTGRRLSNLKFAAIKASLTLDAGGR